MSRLLLKAYAKLSASPPAVKTLLGTCINCIPSRMVYGQTFNTTRQFIEESEYWDCTTIKMFQIEKIKKLLKYCSANVPFYRDIIRNNRIKIEEMSFKKFRKFPFLTKQIIINNFEQLIAKGFTGNNARYGTTAGSTGEPLGFLINHDTSLKEWAFMTNQWSRVGYSAKDRRVVIRGFVTNANEKDKLYEYNPLRNELILSSFHMTEENMELYLSLMKNFKARFLHCYPSSAYILAKYLKDHNSSDVPRFDAILAGSENVYDDQREFVREIFGCRYYSWYGQSEKVVLGGECEFSSNYHLFPQYGYTELLNRDGMPVQNNGELGEIVGTGFLNTAMPFIRYKTGDIGIYTDEECKCGRHYLLIKKVEGRLQEYIVGKQGNLISYTALNMHSDVFDNVRRYRFFQEKEGEVILFIEKTGNYSDRDTNKIISKIGEKVNDQISLDITFVQNLNLTESGKFKTIEQKLDVNKYLNFSGSNQDN